MKHPWDFGRVQADDMESLQTDVMRFIAILGLCLAAIFSLVNAAQLEEVPAEPVEQGEVSAMEPIKEPTIEPTIEIEEKPERLHEPPPRPPPVEQLARSPAVENAPAPEQVSSAKSEDQAQPGFTLEFESPAILQALISRNLIELYALTPDAYWRFSPEGGLQVAEPPATYYAMQGATVPVAIRSSVSALQLEQAPAWGVTLPPGTARQISRLTAGRDGGSLVIGADAGVYLGQ